MIDTQGKLQESFASVVTMESRTEITDYFYSLLSRESMESFDKLLSVNPSLREQLTQSQAVPLQNRLPLAEQKRNLLYAGHHYLPKLFGRDTGLFDFSPPDTVHCMVRNVAYCGDLYYADLVAEAAVLAGFDFKKNTRLLDFGCSSGRVLMPLATALTSGQCRCYGCDPIESAISWARTHINKAQFLHMQENPPLGYPNEAFELVYAISIWSHFSLERANLWFHELHRVMAPDGLAILTTHGLGALHHFEESSAMDEKDIHACQHALSTTGHFFFDVYQQQKDWGLQSPGWGFSFFHPLFFIQCALSSGFSLRGFWPRRAEANQDVFALQRL